MLFLFQKVLLVTSSADSDLWIVPAGGIDPGETSEQAAVREVCEEVISLHGDVLF